MLELIIDDRERSVFPYIATELVNTKHTIKRCTVGDYAVICANTILAVFERKTYEDFASSIKDGRHENKQKLIDLREITNCQIYYIIEGKAFPQAEDTFHEFPYTTIESAIDHLVIRDRINILYTRDKQHTLIRLARFIKSMESLYKNGELPLSACFLERGLAKSNDSPLYIEGAHDESMEEFLNQDTGPKELPSALELLNSKPPEKLAETVKLLWASFSGISTAIADLLVTKYSIADVILGNATDLANVKYSSGRSIPKKVVHTLASINSSTEIKILSNIPGISAATAKKIIDQKSLQQILNGETASISVYKDGRKLGVKRIEKIIQYLTWKHVDL